MISNKGHISKPGAYFKTGYNLPFSLFYACSEMYNLPLFVILYL